jgi:CRISPR-associated protein Csb2
MLAIEVEFLNGRCYAATHTDRGVSEWPPHPSRLFSALVAAFHESDGSAIERAALEWLEQQKPPTLAASGCSVRECPEVFVPVNDATVGRPPKGKAPGDYLKLASLLPERRGRQPRRFPSVTPASPIVYFIWREAVPGDAVYAALVSLCGKVASLGHSASLVRTTVNADPPVPNYVPDDEGALFLRTPTLGQLQGLEEEFQIHQGIRQHTLATGFTAYRVVDSTKPDHPLIHSLFSERWVLFRCRNRLTLRATLPLCTALRDALMKHGPQPPPEWLSGHTPDGKPSQQDHAAFIPLADVGHWHAQGHVLGVAVVLPSQLPADVWATIQTTGLKVRRLTFGRAGACEVEVLPGVPDRDALRPRTWTRRALTWASVTPVVLDRYPKKDPYGEEAVAIIRAACQRVGLPIPMAVTVTAVSQVLAVPVASEFPVRALPGKPHRLHVHVQLEFQEAVVGPILIGAGRYYGYGLFRPLKED